MAQISKKVFDKEIAMCKELSHKNGRKCNWGECDRCGVIPLLHKLYNGILLENQAEIDKAKNKVIL